MFFFFAFCIFVLLDKICTSKVGQIVNQEMIKAEWNDANPYIESGKVVIIDVNPQNKCNGTIKRLRFYAGVSAPFKLAVFRRDAGGDDTKWKLVGINNVPATQVMPNQTSIFEVPFEDRIPFRHGRDVIGMAIGTSNNPEIYYYDKSTTTVSGPKNKREFSTSEELVIGSTYRTTEEPKDYAIREFEATISNEAEAQGKMACFAHLKA